MDVAEVRCRRLEAEARLKSDLRAYERALGEYREFIRDLREKCPHDDNVVKCDACGLLIDQKRQGT